MKSREKFLSIERAAKSLPALALELYSAPLDEPQTTRTLVKKILGPKLNFPLGTRPRSVVHLVAKPANALGANVEQWIHNKMNKTTGVKGDMSLIGNGKEHFIYKVEAGEEQEEPYVLKMDKVSIDMTQEEMMQRISELRSTHDHIAARYRDVEGLIMPVSFEIRKFPYGGKEAIGRRQPYLEGLRDIYQDFSDDELSQLFRDDPKFRGRFITFANITHDVYESTGQVADVYGSGNLCVVKNPDSTNRLVLVDDSRDFDLSHPKTPGEKMRKKSVETKLKRLKELSDMAKHTAA